MPRQVFFSLCPIRKGCKLADMRLLCCAFVVLTVLSHALVIARPLGEPDISGVWEGVHEGGRFRVLSIFNRDAGEGYYFIMLAPGRDERECGFVVGELLATLVFVGRDCWIAREKFRYPLWAGGGSYMGYTDYCLGDPDELDFHTEEEAAWYSDYVLWRKARGIDAAGVWEAAGAAEQFSMLLTPRESGGWEGLALTETDVLGVGDRFIQGDMAPNAEGVDALMCFENANDPGWLMVRVVLSDDRTLRIGAGGGPESGWEWAEFQRIY